MREDQLPSELSDLAAAEAGIDAQREEIEGLQSENAALREEIESLRERWACVECGRTPDGGKSGDLYISICYGCHRCVEHAEPTCTVCAYDTEGMRLRNRDLLVQLEQAEERADRAEARLARVVEARYAILSAYHDGPPEAMALAIQQLSDALAAAQSDDAEKSGGCECSPYDAGCIHRWGNDAD